MNRLIIGCGYLGTEIAKQWLLQGDQVFALTRSEDRIASLASIGVQPLVWNWYSPAPDDAIFKPLETIDTVVVCVSHAAQPNIPPKETHIRGLENLLDFWRSRSLPLPERWCYLSTTGVYAPRYDGSWVNESAEVLGQRAGSLAAINAENWINQNVFHCQASYGSFGGILRAAGIYGPGRVPRLDVLRRNEALQVDPDSYLNLIHVADLAAIVLDVCERNLNGPTLNVADGCPVIRREYYDFIAEQIGCQRPRFEPPANSQVGQEQPPIAQDQRYVVSQDRSKMRSISRGEGSKRVSIDKLQGAINYRFKYPNYKVGLAPLLVS